MKKTIFAATFAAFLLSLSSCDSKSKLADDIAGSWASSPERFVDNQASSASIIQIIDFTKDQSKTGGTLTMSGLFSIMTAMPQSDRAIQPLSVTASGVASIAGEWTVIDDDEISVFLDAKTLNVNVDPSAVVLDDNLLTNESTPDTTSLKPALARSIEAQIKSAVGNQFFNVRKIDDIKIKDNIMSCEINKRDLTLRRQTVD